MSHVAVQRLSMTATPDAPPSKGMVMIAAYRAARLRQRPVLRTNLHELHAKHGSVCREGQGAGEPACVMVTETHAPAGNAPPDDAGPDDAGPAALKPAESVPSEPLLAELGFGPVMLIRLGQLGLHTAGDLAHTDATTLRAALGDISRLVDVEGWIASARRAVSAAPTNVAII